jgi:hypothetical protein
MRRCTKCGAEKGEAEFTRDAAKVDGLRSWCRACDRARRSSNAASIKAYNSAYWGRNAKTLSARAASYRAANAESIKVSRAAYNEANADLIRAYNAEYRSANAESIKAKRAAHYADNQSACRARSVAYYANNAEVCRARSSAYRAANADKVAEYRLLVALSGFGISEEAWRLRLTDQENRCQVCGGVFVTGCNDQRRPCVEHSHEREARGLPSLRGIVCAKCNWTRIRHADHYLKNRGILDTDPEAFPALMKRKVSFAENVANHVTGEWRP